MANTEAGSVEGVLAAVAELAPSIRDRAPEIEAARRTPPDLVDQLAAIGCFRFLLPASHGGLGGDLPHAMRMLEALSRADASVGWNVAIGSGAWCDLVGLPRATFDALFATGDRVIIGGAFNPQGAARPTTNGYEVTGRWAFASGCQHCTWLYGNCMEDTGGEPRIRTAVFAPEQVEIEDTWYVSGLRGTGSHHFRADSVALDADWTVAMFEAEPCIDTPMVRIPPPSLFALALASVAIGVAEGALDDIVALATGKVPLLAGTPLAQQPEFQFELATDDTEVRAARALLHEHAAEAWATAQNAGEFTLPQRARIRAAAAWAAGRAAAAVTGAYHAGGGAALYDSSPLQRRLRDMHAITQHFLVRADTLTTAGAVFAGQDIHVPVF
jgi:alkylation response protein AidB-like acyl-CoA dehydrogenase